MKEIQLKELVRIAKFLKSIDCEFKIISTDGTEFGELKTVKPAKRAKRQYKYGEVAAFYRTKIDVMSPIGSVQEVDPGEYGPTIVRSGICLELTKVWGKDSYTTSVNTRTNKIEILRIR